MELKRTLKGKYFIELPDDLMRLTGWKDGDEIDVRSGADLSAGRGDLVLRKR
jgi:hypothetical protein